MAGQGCVSVVMDSEKGAFGMPSKTFSYKMTAIRGEHCRWNAEQKDKRAALDIATVDELNAVFDAMLNHILSIKEQGKKSLLKTITTRTHFLSCCYIQHKANKEGREGNVFPWMASFFSSSVGPSTSSQYNDACRQGSSKAEAVDDRLSLCRWSFDEACQPQIADKAA